MTLLYSLAEILLGMVIGGILGFLLIWLVKALESS